MTYRVEIGIQRACVKALSVEFFCELHLRVQSDEAWMKIDGFRRLKGGVGLFLESVQLWEQRAARESCSFRPDLYICGESGEVRFAFGLSDIEESVFGTVCGSESAAAFQEWDCAGLGSFG